MNTYKIKTNKTLAVKTNVFTAFFHSISDIIRYPTTIIIIGSGSSHPLRRKIKSPMSIRSSISKEFLLMLFAVADVVISEAVFSFDSYVTLFFSGTIISP